MASTMSIFVEETRLSEASTAFRARFPEIMFDGLIILPGALELIEFFAQHNVSQAIFTNKHGETARQVSAHCGFADYIQACIGNTDTEWAKPQKELTDYVLQQISASASGAAMIGDSPTDGETAANAGLAFYGVTTGAHTKDELLASGALAAYPSLIELKATFA